MPLLQFSQGIGIKDLSLTWIVPTIVKRKRRQWLSATDLRNRNETRNETIGTMQCLAAHLASDRLTAIAQS